VSTGLTPAATLRAAAGRLRADEFTAMPWDEPLAVWLVTEAASSAGDEDHVFCTAGTCTTIAALAVARAVLGEGA
jgi:hypothetical protein